MFVGYHGTRPERAEQILRDGFKLDGIPLNDYGDLGRGVYLYPTLAWAKILSRCVLEVIVEGNFLILVPPELYKIMDFLRKKLGCTIHNPPDKRLKSAWAWRDYFLRLGYDGLLVKGWDTPARTKGYEAVVFNLEAVKEVKVIWRRVEH